jgi:abhydrolase domain-containing protein 12
MIFVHHMRTPFFANISDPASFGLQAAREFELKHKDGCTLQIWQILPKEYHHHGPVSDGSFITALSDGSPIILYMHGNTGTRAIKHRVLLYKYLSEVLNYHVITFDYRGFGNSACYPSERGMMEDGRLVWNWARAKAPGAKLFVWGHSLGSAAATYLSKELCQRNDLPAGLILEAPFPDIVTAGENHPFSIPYWPVMPIFSYLVLQTFDQKFESVKRLEHIRVPILIMHGRSDFIVQFRLGKQMHQVALESRKKNLTLGEVKFVDCGEEGHKTSWESPQAKKAVKQFVRP